MSIQSVSSADTVKTARNSSSNAASTTHVEWPTIIVGAVCYGGIAGLIVFWSSIPLWIAIPATAYLVALHGSLTHEAVHGHPTQRGWFNEAFVGLPLSLWIPFRRYRDWHIAHHSAEILSQPIGDSESHFVSPEAWARMAWPLRAFHWADQTLLGRMTLGTLSSILCYWSSEFRLLCRGDRYIWKSWSLHTIGMGLLFAFIGFFGSLEIWEYALFCALPGQMLTSMRTFLEHQPGPDKAHRCALVEACWPMSFLFLFNNLHLVHHDRPAMPWYRIPGDYRRNRDRYLARNGGYRYSGYAEIAFRYLVIPKEHPAQTGLSNH